MSLQKTDPLIKPSLNGKFTKDLLRVEAEKEIDVISQKLKKDILKTTRRNGAIVGISGGIDSSVTLALTVKAIGANNVIGIMLPEKDSSDDSKKLALSLADRLGIKTLEENITAALEGFKCYERRDEAVRVVFPEYDPHTYTMKIGVNAIADNPNLPPVFSVSIIDQDGNVKTNRLQLREYLQVVAASNLKQRCRMSMLYYHAERMHYAVIGTPNKHEVEQGFFVKHGDGAADIMPIAHLYKTQVYQLARHLNIPEEILERTPTSDTYPAEQTQEEFFFQIPFAEMDLLWYAYENNYTPAEVAGVMEKTEQEVKAIFQNFARKQKTTAYLRMSPIKHDN